MAPRTEDFAERLMTIAREIFRLERDLAYKRREFARMFERRSGKPLERPALREEEVDGVRVLVHDKKEP